MRAHKEVLKVGQLPFKRVFLVLQFVAQALDQFLFQDVPDEFLRVVFQDARLRLQDLGAVFRPFDVVVVNVEICENTGVALDLGIANLVGP